MRCVTRCFSCFDSVDDLDDYRDPRLSDGGQPRGPIQICTPTVASLAQLQPVQEMRQPRERDRAHRWTYPSPSLTLTPTPTLALILTEHR